MPITGCGSTGITLSKDKVISKKILSYHNVLVPEFMVQQPGQLIEMRSGMNFPLIVKPAREEASCGISLKSAVNNEAELVNRVCFVYERSKQSIGGEIHRGSRSIRGCDWEWPPTMFTCARDDLGEGCSGAGSFRQLQGEMG